MPRTGSSKRTRLLFSLLLVALTLAVGGVLLTIFNLRLMRERAHLRATLYQRFEGGVTLATLSVNQSEARRAHLRQCYFDPSIDLQKISWNLLCRPSPHVGYAPEPGTQQEGRFNSSQLRDSREVELPKPADVYRIFVTGGSFAFSMGASTQAASITSRLEAELNNRSIWPGRRAEVWNAAVPAWCSTHERLWVESHLLDLQPDMILQLTGVNDVHWGELGFNILALRTYEEQMYLDVLQSAMRIAGVRPYPLEPWPRLKNKRTDLPVTVTRFMQNQTLLATLLAARGVEHVVALQPNLHPENKPITPGEQAWLDEHENNGKFDYINDGMELLVKTMEARAVPAGLPPLPPNRPRLAHVRDVFRGRSDPIYLDTYHLGDKGNQLMAMRLADELQRLYAPAP